MPTFYLFEVVRSWFCAKESLALLRANPVGHVLLLVELLRADVGECASLLQAVDRITGRSWYLFQTISLSTITVMTFKSIPLCYACYVRGSYECGWGRQQNHLVLYARNCPCNVAFLCLGGSGGFTPAHFVVSFAMSILIRWFNYLGIRSRKGQSRLYWNDARSSISMSQGNQLYRVVMA